MLIHVFSFNKLSVNSKGIIQGLTLSQTLNFIVERPFTSSLILFFILALEVLCHEVYPPIQLTLLFPSIISLLPPGCA